MKQIPTIEIENCLSKATQATAEAINKRIVAHNAEIVAHSEQAAALAGQNIDLIDPNELFNPAFQRESFRLRRQELQVRRNMAELFKARAADRRAQVEALFPKIDEAREAIVKKLHKIGFAGDGRVYDNRLPGGIFPGMITAHPSVQAAHADHQNAKAIADSFADAQANNQSIIDLEAALQRMQSAATAA